MAKNKAPTGIKTAVTDKPITTQPANTNTVVVARQVDGEDTVGTTQKLFSDLLAPDNAEKPGPQEPIPQSPPEEPNPASEPEQPPAQPVPQEPPAPETPPASPAPSDEFLDIEALANKKIKTKIDGKEEVRTLKELRDQYQIKKHLDQAADRIGDERRKLAEERRQLQELRANQPPAFVPRETEFQPNGTQPVPQQTPANPPLDPVYARLQFLEQQLHQLTEGTRPAIYQSNRQRVAQELQSQGFNDFLDYIPKMEAHMGTIPDPQMQAFYDTPMGAKALYFQLKAQEMKDSMMRPPNPGVPPPPPPSAAPARPPITKIDGGSQPSGSNTDDSAYRYRQAFKRATALGDDRDAWNEVLRQKGVIPD